MQFHVDSHCGQARAGELRFPRGTVPTPAFMPVGTQATVKGLTPRMMVESGARMILANAYHLMLRPGENIIRDAGGLHAFMGWDGPILTDSGGYQVFSLGKHCRVTERGACFRSPLNGQEFLLDAERSVAVQIALGSDVTMAFDECTAHPVSKAVAEASMQRSMRWAARSKAAHAGVDSAIFGIVQGGMYTDLRATSAAMLCDMAFDGYAIGGLSVGEDAETRVQVLADTLPLLPENQPRYLMGIGRPEDLLTAIRHGVDLFDCVIPTRNARTGFLYTSRGILKIGNAAYRKDLRPVDLDCACYTCKHFSRAYLNHLDHSNEMLGPILNTFHNLHYYQNLLKTVRNAIKSQTLTDCIFEFEHQQNTRIL